MISIRIITVVVLMLVVGIALTTADCDMCGSGDPSPGPGAGWDSYYDSIGWGSSGGSGGSGDGGSGTTDTSGPGNSGGSGSSSGTDTSSSESSGSSYVSGGSVEDGLLSRMKGDELFSKGLYEEALTEYQKSTMYDPYSSRSWKGKGMTLQALVRPDEAVVAFQRALKLDPGRCGNPGPSSVMPSLMPGSTKKAVGQYTKALGMNPNLQGVTQKLSAASTLALGIVELPEETPEPAPEETTPAPVTTRTPPPDESTNLPPQQTAPFPGVMLILLASLAGLFLALIRIR